MAGHDLSRYRIMASYVLMRDRYTISHIRCTLGNISYMTFSTSALQISKYETLFVRDFGDTLVIISCRRMFFCQGTFEGKIQLVFDDLSRVDRY